MENQKVLLVNPPKHPMNQANIWKKIDTQLPSLGLASIAAYLEAKGIEVKILDLVVEGYEMLGEFLQEFRPNFVGLTASTVTINSALQIADFAKKKLPGAKVVIGGPHASLLPKEMLERKSIDFVVIGEGEITFAELVKNAKKPSKVDGIAYRKNRTVKFTRPRKLVCNLDDLPMPAYHLLPVKKYKPSLGNFKRLPAMSVICGRGCPGRCTYCASGLFGEKFRFKSVQKVLDEIKYLVKNFGIKEITFYDETFTANRNFVKELCRRIIEEKIDISWMCSARVDTVDDETLRLMKKAGCHQVAFGIESADERILENINKKISLEKAVKAVEMTQNAGIEARANFMFGSPGETEETMQKTLNFALKLEPDYALFNITTPLPGTEMFRWAKQRKLLRTEDWKDYDFSKHVMNLPTVSSEKVLEYYRKAHRQFYMRPKYIIKRLLRIRSMQDLKNNLESFRILVAGGE